MELLAKMKKVVSLLSEVLQVLQLSLQFVFQRRGYMPPMPLPCRCERTSYFSFWLRRQPLCAKALKFSRELKRLSFALRQPRRNAATRQETVSPLLQLVL